MLNNKSQIIKAIKKVTGALADLNDACIFVGGAVTGLYANDPAAVDVRPTRDIDLVFEIATYLELTKLESELRKKGFKRSMDENVICRFVLDNIPVDVMSTKEVGWAPTNPWFGHGFRALQNFELQNIIIKILPFEYFLATKFIAFEDRGGDPRTSHDLEDIVYLLDNRLDLVSEIKNCNQEVRVYLIKKFKELIEQDWQEAIMAHLEPATQTERFNIIIAKLYELVK